MKSLPDISNWNISNVSNISDLFRKCSSLMKLPDISKWDTSNVLSLNGLFFDCSQLEFLPDISKWNVNKIIDLSHLFLNCSSLKRLPDISKWKIFSNNKDYLKQYKSFLNYLYNDLWKYCELSEIFKLNSIFDFNYNDRFLENYSSKQPQIKPNSMTKEEYIDIIIKYIDEIKD